MSSYKQTHDGSHLTLKMLVKRPIWQVLKDTVENRADCWPYLTIFATIVVLPFLPPEGSKIAGDVIKEPCQYPAKPQYLFKLDSKLPPSRGKS
jgi:hypothetical protein